MKERFVVIPYEREFPVPLAQAYAWLTDYQDDDPQRTTAIVKARPVLERHPDKVVLDGTIEVLGVQGRGRAEVHLFPPDHWEARIVQGQGRGSVYDYRLTPTPRGCRLHVDYRIRTKRLRRYLQLQLLRGRVRREFDTMWAGFERSMLQDLGAQRATV